MSLIQQIRDALGDSGGMTTAQLADALGEEQKRIAATCYEAKGRGVLTSRHEDGGVVYALNTDGAAPKPRPQFVQIGEQQNLPTQAPATRPRKSAPAPAIPNSPEGRDTIAAALQSAYTKADEALDAYVRSVANPTIYGALKQARDHAGAAWRAFRDAA